MVSQGPCWVGFQLLWNVRVWLAVAVIVMVVVVVAAGAGVGPSPNYLVLWKGKQAWIPV